MKKTFWAFPLLFLYGFFYHISSSEFWPITISKTWFSQNGHFEHSILQKPLHSLILAFFHIFPLSDSLHIYLVKAFFTLLGLVGLYFYFALIVKKSQIRLIWTLPLLLLISPALLNNFFNIRTDTLAFVFFGAFLFFHSQKKTLAAIISIFLLALSGIKELIFLLPALCLLYFYFRPLLTRKQFWYLNSALFAVVLWVVALNIPSISYLLDTYRSNNFPNPQLLEYLKVEAYILVLSALLALFNLFKKRQVAYSLLSLYFIFVLFALPQSYSFFIGSVVPFIYLPIFIQIFSFAKKQQQYLALSIGIIASLSLYLTIHGQFYDSNLPQFKFIRLSSELISANHLSYLDGVGILPRQKFYRCFVSPEDTSSNNNCTYLIGKETPDVVIVTNRLLFLNTVTNRNIFETIQSKYTQIYPNLWIKNKKLTTKLLEEKNLEYIDLPVIIF